MDKSDPVSSDPVSKCIWSPTLKRPIYWIAHCGTRYKNYDERFRFCPFCGKPMEVSL